ncbi:MAG TPA: hypothetical protein VMC83_10205 [Streptosporangiaceae bacterium]|nr:hypothetical protein [Streptosporangiaceae bacterium]
MMVRAAGDCYQDETLCDGTVTADQDVVGIGVAVPDEVPSVGVWLGVWVTLGVEE